MDISSLFKNPNIFNDNNKNIIIGIVTVLILIWSLVYAIPDFINSLFHTILGNLILILIVVLLSMNNIVYGISSALIFFILYRMTIISSKEGFSWTQESIDKFIGLQQSINPNVIFDVNKVQEQASQEDVDYFIKNGMWNWSKEVIELYKNAVSNNSYIRNNLGDSVLEARKLYNENIILEILSWQEKEGQFLLTGVTVLYNDADNNNKDRNGLGTYAYNSELVTDVTNPNASVIKCDTDFEINADTNSKIALKQYQYTGDGAIFGEHNTKITDVDYNNLEKLVPGFKFIKEACNPCLALNDPANYSCPFKLDIKDTEKGVSPVWSYLWRTKGNITDPELKPMDVSSSDYTGMGDYPILTQLKNELNKIHL